MREDFKTTLSSIPCGLCVYRFERGKIFPVYHNSVFYEIMGYTEDHIRLVEKETNFLGVHPDELGKLQMHIQEAIRSNGSMQFTYRLWNDTRGEYRWIHLEGSVKETEEDVKQLYGVYSDVTGQIQTEKELSRANEKCRILLMRSREGWQFIRCPILLIRCIFPMEFRKCPDTQWKSTGN